MQYVNYGQGSSREHAAFARVRPHPPGNMIAKGSPRSASTPTSTTDWRWAAGWRFAGLGAAVTNSADKVEIQTERHEPFQARLDLPRERRVLIVDSVLNQLSTERTHHDGSALTLAHRQRNRQMWEV